MARNATSKDGLVNTARLHDLVLQSLEHEKGGVRVYETALECTIDANLREEWSGYLAQTRRHVEVLIQVCRRLGIDPDRDTPSRQVVRTVGEALVNAMRLARRSGDPDAAQIVACEAVVLAETKDHSDWALLAKCAEAADGPVASALKAACDEVEDEEDEHLYHSKGWCRELWLQALGMRAVLPPPEEQRHVKTAIGAARAQKEGDRLR